MKKIFFLPLLLAGCIQTDVEDPFPPTLMIDNTVSSIDFRVNGAYPLDAVYTDFTGEPADVPIGWTSSDDQVLSFADNIAMPHEEGLVIITAEANGLEETFAVEVLSSRELITISGFVPVKQVGSSATLIANYIDPDGTTLPNISPEWTSSVPSIAEVDNIGTVTALAPGNTTISVSFNNVSSSMNLEVTTDPVLADPEIKITSFAIFLSEGEQFQFEADYLNSSGEVDNSVTISWASSDESILSIDANGLATANASGTASIEASFEDVSASVIVEVEGGAITERTGSLMGTGYDIVGDFRLNVNDDGDLILTVTGYRPDGPGPYFYLTNQSSNVNNGVNLGDARAGGDYTINVTEIDNSVQITTFNFLMVWCEPFRVRLGVGEFEN